MVFNIGFHFLKILGMIKNAALPKKHCNAILGVVRLLLYFCTAFGFYRLASVLFPDRLHIIFAASTAFIVRWAKIPHHFFRCPVETGATIIAAPEDCSVHAIEIDPIKVDSIVARWELATGSVAVLNDAVVS